MAGSVGIGRLLVGIARENKPPFDRGSRQAHGLLQQAIQLLCDVGASGGGQGVCVSLGAQRLYFVEDAHGALQRLLAGVHFGFYPAQVRKRLSGGIQIGARLEQQRNGFGCV